MNTVKDKGQDTLTALKKCKRVVPIGIIMFIIGLVVGTIALDIYPVTSRDNIEIVYGIVVDYRVKHMSGQNKYYPIYEYDLNGQTNTYESMWETILSGVIPTIGKEVKLYYNTSLKTFTSSRVATYLSVLSLIMLLLGFCVFAATIYYTIRTNLERKNSKQSIVK
jgi:hypothetical protein